MFGRNSTENQSDLEIFAIYDTKAKAYKPPAFAKNRHIAVRDLTNVMRDNPKHELFLNAEDFQVFKLGSYSFQSGKIEAHPPEHVANLHEIKASAQ